MTPEQWMQGIGIGFAVIVAMAAAFFWGWDCRERLAVKIEHFRVSNRQWLEYDEALKQQRGKLVPKLRADLHDINERESQR